LAALPATTIEPALALAASLTERALQDAESIGRAFRWSNHLIRQVTWLVASLPHAHTPASLELADLKTLMADEEWPMLPELLRADLLAQGRSLETHDRFLTRASSIRPEDVAPAPLLTGEHLNEMSMTPGPRYGEILKAVYRAQLNGIVRTPQEAVELAKRLWR
jgi:hypothetical protein